MKWSRIRLMIRLHRTYCNKDYAVSEKHTGQTRRCPECKHRIAIPNADRGLLDDKDIVKFRCPSCNQKIGVTPEHCGRRVRCAKCKSPLVVPDRQLSVAASSPFETAIESDPDSHGWEAGDSALCTHPIRVFVHYVGSACIMGVMFVCLWMLLAEKTDKEKATIAVASILVAYTIYFGLCKNLCPDCHKIWGLRYTGEKENLNADYFYWFIPDNEYLYRCKRCGYEDWRRPEGHGGP